MKAKLIETGKIIISYSFDTLMPLPKPLDRFERLKVNQINGVPAPHKPLLILMMLARLRNEGVERLTFNEIRPVLKNLLRVFTGHGHGNDQSPFWFLRKDDVWFVDIETDDVEVATHHQPSISVLENRNPASGFSQDILNSLQSTEEIDRLANYLLGEYFAPYEDQVKLREALGLSDLKIPTLDTETSLIFQRSVFHAYQSRCAVCGTSPRILNRLIDVRATHIKPPAQGGTYDTENGLALCSQHHTHFVQGAFSLDPQDNDNCRILVANLDDVLSGFENIGEHLSFYPQNPTMRPSPLFLEWHRENIFADSRFL